MQEIADEAGMNKALLHYYFRSKENLFRAVFKDIFTKFFSKVKETIFSDASTKEKSFLTYKPFLHVFDSKGERVITNDHGQPFPHHRGIFIGWRVKLGDAKTAYNFGSSGLSVGGIGQ